MRKISVVMASYNHAPFVAKAVDSVLTQDGVEVELVITDDGSRDGTAAVIQAISDSRVRLRVLPQNVGACVALNDAITRADGSYIAVLNSDDYFLPGKLARQAAYLDEHPEIGAVFGLPAFVDERGQALTHTGHALAHLFTAVNRPRREWLRQFFRHGNCLCHPTLLIRRECYERIGMCDPLLMQLPDFDLWVRLCSHYDIHVMPQPLTAFRILDRGRNTSVPSLEREARAAWETTFILRRFVQLSDADVAAVLGDTGGEADAMPPRVRLALAAIRLEKPGYVQFGLALLRESMNEHPDLISYPDYFRLVGRTDPCGTEYRAREFQIMRTSRLMRFLRRAFRLLRNRIRG